MWDIGASQDERRNTDPATKAAVPWLVRNVTVSDNLYGSAGSFQFYALDKATHIPASTMNITVDGNAFPGNTHAVMVGWGGSDNSTVTYYRSPSALDAGLHVSWTNVLVDNGSSDPEELREQQRRRRRRPAPGRRRHRDRRADRHETHRHLLSPVTGPGREAGGEWHCPQGCGQCHCPRAHSRADRMIRPARVERATVARCRIHG